MSRKMIDYKVEDGKIVSIDGYEVGGGGGYKIQKLIVTENGLYDNEFEAYKPVYVNVPQVAQDGSLKALLDGTKSAQYLFYKYNGTNVDDLISYSDTANVTNMEYMFYNCENLTTIPLLDTSKVTNMKYMFQNCKSLTTIPQLILANNVSMYGMFYGCSNLTTIPRIDASAVSTFAFAFDSCTSLTSLGLYDFRKSIAIHTTGLEHDALVAVLNQAGIPADPSNARITIGSAKLALLSDEEKAIATNKGWTLA